MLGHRDSTEAVDVLDGIGLLQRSPVGWHLYQHLIRKAGIGLLLLLDNVDGGAGPLRFLVAALMEGGPARLTGEIAVVRHRTSHTPTTGSAALMSNPPANLIWTLLPSPPFTETVPCTWQLPRLHRFSLSP